MESLPVGVVAVRGRKLIPIILRNTTKHVAFRTKVPFVFLDLGDNVYFILVRIGCHVGQPFGVQNVARNISFIVAF